MADALPLDDVIGQTFYIDGAPWRLVYNRKIRGFALRRLAPTIEFDRALELIRSGKLRWNPPERFEPLRPDDSVDAVQRHAALLDAFRRSPTCTDATDWVLPSRIDARLAESRTWLSRRALKSGDSVDEPGRGTDQA